MMINLPRAINHYLVPHILTTEKLTLRLVVVDRQSTNMKYDISDYCLAKNNNIDCTNSIEIFRREVAFMDVVQILAQTLHQPSAYLTVLI